MSLDDWMELEQYIYLHTGHNSRLHELLLNLTFTFAFQHPDQEATRSPNGRPI